MSENQLLSTHRVYAKLKLGRIEVVDSVVGSRRSDVPRWLIHFQLLFCISFWHLKILYKMKKKKSSQNLHDVKKYLEVATAV